MFHPRRAWRPVTTFMILLASAMASASAASATVPASESSGGAASRTAAPDPARAERFEAAELAHDRGISVARAEQRLDWQKELPSLVNDAKSQLDGAFGGVWVDASDGDRIKVAVTRDATKADRNAAAATADAHDLAPAVDVVPVKYSESELRAAHDDLAAKIAGAPEAVAAPVSVGLRPDRNAVVLHLPPEAGTAVPAGLAGVVNTAESFGDMVEVQYDAAPVRPLACSYNTYCDPPLRAGIRIWSDAAGCTAAFLARSRTSGALYQFTAGHCVDGARGTWWTHFADGTKHVIGPVHNFRYDSSGDAAILQVSNPSGWRARAWVMVTAGPDTGDARFAYPISRDAKSVIGQRVCTSGSWSVQSDCGKVTELGVTGYYQGVTDLVRSTLCVIPGDSGAPVYATHTAYGIVAAYGSGDRCDVLYQDIQNAENLMNVNVSHE